LVSKRRADCAPPLIADVRQLGPTMRYQLVLQMQGDSAAHYEALISLEERLLDALDESAEVDGHDIGSGESNIFILTENPRQTFDQSRPILESARLLDSVRAAYRGSSEEQYTVIWPPGDKRDFTVI
jgi:hypothetical protein